MKEFPDEDVAVAGVLGPLRLDDMLFQAARAARIAPVQVLRADRVAGADHVRSAAWHTHRAFREGRNQADRLEVEFTRYAAGERQIKVALAKLGVRDGEEAAIVVGLGNKGADAVRYFVDGLGLKQDDSLLAPREEVVAAFGIPAQAVAATTPGRRLDLVLEAVAAVDTMRR